MKLDDSITQQARLFEFLGRNTIARASELRAIGASGTAISRAVEAGKVLRMGRGLYRLADAEVDINLDLAEVAKRAPRAVICLASALAFHGLTDQLPRRVWTAIGARDWKPKIVHPPVRFVRFREPYFSAEIEEHEIGGTKIKVYSVNKSIADAFRNPKLTDRSVAIGALKSALRDNKTNPGAVLGVANENGAGKVIRPYIEALVTDG